MLPKAQFMLHLQRVLVIALRILILHAIPFPKPHEFASARSSASRQPKRVLSFRLVDSYTLLPPCAALKAEQSRAEPLILHEQSIKQLQRKGGGRPTDGPRLLLREDLSRQLVLRTHRSGRLSLRRSRETIGICAAAPFLLFFPEPAKRNPQKRSNDYEYFKMRCYDSLLRCLTFSKCFYFLD